MEARTLPHGVRSLLIVGGAYVAAQMMADIASLRIIDVAGNAVDAGTLIYPFTFTLRDLAHKIAGKDAARTLIFLAAGINLVMAGFFWLVADLPADSATGPLASFRPHSSARTQAIGRRRARAAASSTACDRP